MPFPFRLDSNWSIKHVKPHSLEIFSLTLYIEIIHHTFMFWCTQWTLNQILIQCDDPNPQNLNRSYFPPPWYLPRLLGPLLYIDSHRNMIICYTALMKYSTSDPDKWTSSCSYAHNLFHNEQRCIDCCMYKWRTKTIKISYNFNLALCFIQLLYINKQAATKKPQPRKIQ